MLTQAQAENLAVKHQTIVDNILKEHYQVYVLDQLFSSRIGPKLIFKGGTALRLAYNSFRFSEDLDFSVQNPIDYSDFQIAINRLPAIFPECLIKDIYDKHQTLFAKISFNVGFKPIPIGIKIEINKIQKKTGFEPKSIRSEFNNLVVIGQVFTLSSILTDKKEMIVSRREPRDLFDLWYINDLMKKQFTINPKYKYSKKEIQDRLNPLIPQKFKAILNLFQK